MNGSKFETGVRIEKSLIMIKSVNRSGTLSRNFRCHYLAISYYTCRGGMLELKDCQTLFASSA